LENPVYTPPFGLAQRARFGNFNPITNLAGIILIVRHKFIPPTDILLVQGMLDQPLHLHNDGFVHFIADYNAVNLSSRSSCFHMRP